MRAALSVFAGPHCTALFCCSVPVHAAEIVSVLGSMSSERTSETPIAKISGLDSLSSAGNRFGPFGAPAPGIVYVLSRPGTGPGSASGLTRSTLPSYAFVLAAVPRASLIVTSAPVPGTVCSGCALV